MMILMGILNKSVRLATWKSKMAAILKMAAKIDLLKVISPWNQLDLVDFDDLSFNSHVLEGAEFIFHLSKIQNGVHIQDGAQNWPNESIFAHEIACT